MDASGPRFPLFNRLVVLILSGAVLLGMIALFVIAVVRDGLDLASGFLVVVFSGMACWGVWVSLRWPGHHLDMREVLLANERRRLSANAIICQFFTGLRTGTVLIEPDAAVIRFDNCHVPNRFLAVAQRSVRCSLTEIRDFYSYQGRGLSVAIRTATGRVVIPGHATNYDQLVDFLQRRIPVRTAAFGADHPLMGIFHFVGAAGGLIGGVSLTPRNAGNSVLGVLAIVGAFVGTLASLLLVNLADRYLKADMMRRIGFGGLGFVGGLTFALLLAPLFAWNPVPFVALATVGVIIGVYWGSRSVRSS